MTDPVLRLSSNSSLSMLTLPFPFIHSVIHLAGIYWVATVHHALCQPLKIQQSPSIFTFLHSLKWFHLLMLFYALYLSYLYLPYAFNRLLQWLIWRLYFFLSESFFHNSKKKNVLILHYWKIILKKRTRNIKLKKW